MSTHSGSIIVSPGANIWPHELKTAQALAAHGYIVRFIRKSEIDRETSADVIIDNLQWEIKSPTSSSLRALDRNVRKALHQSSNVIVDSFRIKQIPDHAIERELRKLARELRSLKRLLFVSRHRDVIDIK